MTTMRACFLFLGGLIAGISLTIVLFLPLPRAVAAPSASGGFPDVSPDHYAAASVKALKAKGIVQGYPDGAYKGNLPVTRYEAAMLLARFAQYYEKSHAPLSAAASTDPVSASAPEGHWAKDSQVYLATNGFASPKSPLFAPPGKAAMTANEFADSTSVMVDQLSSRSLAPRPEN